MGNIKHNDELLRVHDDGFDVVFNCDNKHQNGVSYHAEKNGKKTKIDPEYAMAALVKKVSGAGWPADLPAPSAGGYGYTEQESRVAFEGNTDPSGGWEYEMESSEPVLEVGKTYTVVIDDDEYANLTAAADEWGGVVIGDRSYADYPFMISAYPYAIYIYLDPSIYARGTTYSIKIESTEETIHKINEKYLPEISPTDEVLENAKETGGIGWTESGIEVTIIDNESVVTEKDDPDDPDESPHGWFTSFEIEDKAYTVVFDGTEYNAQGIIDADGDTSSYIGDFSFETYPFAIIYANDFPERICLLLTENEGTHTLSIKTIGEEIHKIESKYLSPADSPTVENAKEIGGIAYTEFVESETIMSERGTFHNKYVNLDGKELVLDEKYSCHIELGSESDHVVINAEDIMAEGNASDYEHSASLYFTDDDGNEWQIEGYANPETDAPNTMAYTISCYDMDLDEDIDIFIRITGPCDVVHTINPKYVPIEKGTGFYGTSCMLHDDITPDSAPGTEITYYPPGDFRLNNITVSEAIQRGVYVSAKIAIKVKSGARTNTVYANLTFSEVGQTTLGRVCYFAGFSRPTDAVNDIYYVCMALPDFPEEHNNKATLMAIKKLTLS